MEIKENKTVLLTVSIVPPGTVPKSLALLKQPPGWQSQTCNIAIIISQKDHGPPSVGIVLKLYAEIWCMQYKSSPAILNCS